jgi:hypothetical protein
VDEKRSENGRFVVLGASGEYGLGWHDAWVKGGLPDDRRSGCGQ